ncbi:hypothetical protein O163_13750 [Caldanaerobacter subterraneus subsp. yonseiensis KB-1]|uniref:Uncharacterized protein n=1 Tax=Caldanaerobacter subterraneus subsp. yonseiensis KB-1 TaxID=1388761 RepID=U5CPG8_CALSX|nr:type IV secretory system conjugative DNA transfer family protein [Caldanaerobacter subterraneus]ERM90831.1 hypothetical protein O163_13750 [Caldanaerobacter subterraneus subsp. yonseiensis KB-1]
MGCTDVATAQFVSDLLGQATVEARSHRKHAGFEGIFDFGDISISSQKRPLLTPDEILRLDHRNAIVILRGQKPLLVEKMDYTKHPLSKEIKPVPITEYVPEWAEQENKESKPAEEPAGEDKNKPAKRPVNELAETVKNSEKPSENTAEEEVFFISNTFSTAENGQIKISEADTSEEAADKTAEKEEQKKKKNKKQFW